MGDCASHSYGGGILLTDEVARWAGWIQSTVLVGSLGAADLAEGGFPLRGGLPGGLSGLPNASVVGISVRRCVVRRSSAAQSHVRCCGLP